MSSYIGFQDYKSTSLFEDLANMNKTLSISVGLNSHAGNRQDTTLHALPGKTQHKNNIGSLLCAMVNWGNDQNNQLILAIERGDIDPHNLDGNYLFGKTVQLFPGYEGDGTPKARTNVIARLRKKLRNYVFDGTVSGRRKRRAVGELFTLPHFFYWLSPFPFLVFSPRPCFRVGE